MRTCPYSMRRARQRGVLPNYDWLFQDRVRAVGVLVRSLARITISDTHQAVRPPKVCFLARSGTVTGGGPPVRFWRAPCKARFPVVQPHPPIAPAGSKRSSHGG